MVTRLRALLRREPLLVAAVLLSTVLTLCAIWRDRYVPLLDYPNHLAELYVWRHLGDAALRFAPFYETSLPPLPYWTQYGIEWLLAAPLGEEAAQKLFLSAALLGLAPSVAIYARRIGRDPRLALFALPLAWNFNTGQGFVSYVAGLPLLFLALAAIDLWGERPSLRAGIAATLLGVALYFTHILPWALFLAVGGPAALLAPRPWRPLRAIIAALPTVPALAVGLGCYHLAQHEQTFTHLQTAHGLASFEGVYNDVATNLAWSATWMGQMVPGPVDEIVLAALAITWVLLLARSRRDEDLRSPRAFVLELSLLLVIAVYLVLPRSLLKPFYWYAVNRRLAVVIALFAALLPRGRLVGARRALLVVVALAAVVLPGEVARRFHRFNVRARDYDAVIAQARPGAEVLPLMLNLGDPDVNVNAFNQWGSYVQLKQGGYMYFTLPSEFPVRYTLQRPAPPWNHPELFDFDKHGGAWDEFLVHGPSRIDPFARWHDRVRLVASRGDWSLWERLTGAAR